METIPFGKAIRSTKPEKMYKRFPGNDQVQTLPAGKVSPKILSFIQGKFYQVKGDETGDYYIRKDEASQEIVEPGAKDKSVPGAGLLTGVTDFFNNTGATVKKHSGFYKEGFTQSIETVKTGFEGFGGNLKIGAYLAVPLVAVLVVLIITNRIK